MSLISIRNFTAPFSRKGQLFALLLVVILFTILRLSLPQGRGIVELQDRGSFFSTGERYAPRSSLPMMQQQDTGRAAMFEAPPPPPPARKVAEPAKPAGNAQDDVFLEIFGGGSSSPAQEKAPSQGNSGRGSGGLDDIEHKLGLR